MKIGHYYPGIWAKGGVASYIRRVSREQKRVGHEVVYFDLASSGETSDGTDAPVKFAEDEADLFRLAAAENLDILHVHSTLSPRESFPVPVIRTLHGHQPYCPSGGRFLKRQQKPCDRAYSGIGCAWNHFASRCGSIHPMQMLGGFRDTQREMQTLKTIPTITVSRFLKEQMVRSGYDPKLIHVLHLPAPEVKTYVPLPTAGVPRFVFLGRITPQKGVAWLLRAVKEVTVPIQIDIAGEGYEEPAMRQFAAQLGLEDRVTFHGWVDGEKVSALLEGSRALVFPSAWHEPAGLVSLDAMVNGRPVIASRVGGIPEVVEEGVNGLLVEPNDITGLAQAIERLARDEKFAEHLGKAGHETVGIQFAMDGHMARLMQLYSSADPGNEDRAVNRTAGDLADLEIAE